MMLCMPQLGEFQWFATSVYVLETFLEVFSKDVVNRDESDLSKQSLSVQLLVSIPKEELHEYVMVLQGLLTLNVVTGVTNQSLVVQTINCLDVLWWTNNTFRKGLAKLEAKEFHNDAVNNTLDLSESMNRWAYHTRI